MLGEAPPKFAVVIPACNEASTIADILFRVQRFIKLIIVVNDGSTDKTASVLQTQPVTVLTNPVNLGKGESLCRGAAYALDQGVDFVITLDGDGQHDPEDIPLLIEKAASNQNSIIVGARVRDRQAAPLLRRFANRFADFCISWAAGHRIRDSQSGFRLYPASLFRHCAGHTGGFVFESEILIDAARKGIYTKEVDIRTIYREGARPSHYRPTADTVAIARMVAWKLIRQGLYPIGLLRALGIVT